MSQDTGRRVRVGRFGAPHGVRGEIRLQAFTDNPEAVGAYGPLSGADGRSFVLTSLRRLKDKMLVATVEGVRDRTAAEALTHLDLFVPRAALPAPDDEEFYVVDLIGLAAVSEDGAALGEIVAVPNYGAGDLLEVRPTGAGETRLFAFTKDVVPTIDFTARRVTIRPPVETE